MNKQQFYTLGSALLASTALSSGAMAAAGIFNAAGTSFSTTAIKVAYTAFSTTAGTANALTVGTPVNTAGSIGVAFNDGINIAQAGGTFGIQVTVGNATVVGSSVSTTGSSVVLLTRSTNGSFDGTGGVGAAPAANCSTVNTVGSVITLTGCRVTTSSALSVGGVAFSGIQFTTANSLATSGNSITLSARVYDPANSSTTYDTISAGAVVTAAAPLTASFSAAANVRLTTGSAVAFAYLQEVQTGQTGFTAPATVFTAALASVTITGVSGVYSNDLSQQVTPANTLSSVTVTVSSPLFSGSTSAIAAVRLADAATGALIGTASQTAANFSGGSQTFSILGSGTNLSAFQIQVAFNGSNEIQSATAGSIALAFGTLAAGNSVQTPTNPTNGTTAAFTRGGFSGEVNSIYSSTVTAGTAYYSFVRIHNNGSTAGAATVTVYNDATGAQVGNSFTTASIPANGTVQLSAGTFGGSDGFEKLAGITTPTLPLYTVKVTGPFVGYVQHIVYNSTTQQINDLSAFRNAGQTGAP